jgi:hypothetical protein
MKSSSMFLVGLILSVLALTAIVQQATALVYYRRGVGIRLDNDQQLMFQRPGEYHAVLRLVVWPLWYYQEDLTTYDTVTITLEMVPYRVVHSYIPIIFGDRCTPLGGLKEQCTWTNVHLSQDEDGVTLDATLYLSLDFLVGPADGLGIYFLKLDATASAAAGAIVFEGHTFGTVLVYE